MNEILLEDEKIEFGEDIWFVVASFLGCFLYAILLPIVLGYRLANRDANRIIKAVNS